MSATVIKNKKPRVIVVGGGLAGLMTTIRLAERGIPVDLFSFVPVKRSHSVCAQGGINGAVNTKGEGDSPAVHLDDTVYGGDFLANQPPVKHMADTAPAIINLLDRMGVMFNRTPEGLLDFRRFGGTQHHRTAYAGATTGQQLLYALDEQTRRWEVEGLISKYEFSDFLSVVQDENGVCKGIIAQDLRSMQIKEFRGDAVVLATGGPGVVFGKSTNSIMNVGTAAAEVYQQGATYANGEFVQVHPTAIPGVDKLRLMSESARGEGGRVWVPKMAGDPRQGTEIPEAERFYFLEEKYPAYGNLVPRDIATREIFDICVNQGLGVHGENQVYLDLTHLDKKLIDIKLGGILEIYEKFVGEDPRTNPMRIFPAVHYSMGGLWVDFEKSESGGLVEESTRNHQTTIPGLYAVGECDYQYHGANRLGANSLLTCLTTGMIVGPGVAKYVQNQDKAAVDLPSGMYQAECERQQAYYDSLSKSTGSENPYRLHVELGSVMTDNMTVVRDNAKLESTLGKLDELTERARHTSIADSSNWTNQLVPFTRHLRNMIELAKVMTAGALARDESRGAHFKPEFPERDDERFLKTTRADYTSNGPVLSYEEVDTTLITPRLRNYAVDKDSTLAAAEKSESVASTPVIDGFGSASGDGSASADLTHKAPGYTDGHMPPGAGPVADGKVNPSELSVGNGNGNGNGNGHYNGNGHSDAGLRPGAESAVVKQ